MTKKLISIFVAVMMILSIIPAAALASDGTRLSSPATEKSSPATEKSIAAWDFEEDPTANGWQFADEDGDGHNWIWNDGAAYAHSGTYSIMSESYGSGAYHPDNWAISPSFTVPEGGAEVTMFVKNYSGTYPENYGIYVITADGANEIATGQSAAGSGWNEKLYDISDFAGQTVSFAIRHYNVSDMWKFYIDDITVVAPPDPNVITEADVSGFPVRITDNMTVDELTSALTVPADADYEIADAFVYDMEAEEVLDPAAALEVGAFYMVGAQIAPVEGKTFALDAELTANGGMLTLNPAHSGVDDETTAYICPMSYECSLTPAVGFYFESNPAEEGWQFVDADGDGNNWYWLAYGINQNTGNMAYEGVGHLTSASYNGTALTPDNWAISPEIEVPAVDPTVSMYIGAQDPSYAAEHYTVYVGNGTNVESYTAISDEVVVEGTYAKVELDLADYAGETVSIAIRHFNCTDMFRLNLDCFEVFGSDEETPAEPGVINVVEILDFVEPAWGESPNYTVNVPEDAHYSVVDTVWEYEFSQGGYSYNRVMTPEMIFDNPDYKYRMRINLEADEGYTFDRSGGISIIIDSYGGLQFNSDTQLAVFTEQFTVSAPIIIDTVEVIDFEEPVFGANPDFDVAVPEDANYTLTKVEWHDMNKAVLGEDYEFVAGYYYVIFEFAPNEGYEFGEASETTMLINGSNELVMNIYCFSGPDSFHIETVDLLVEEPEADIIGDADGDGEVTTADALLALRYVMGLDELDEEQLAQADVDGDGEVTMIDCLLIQRYVMGVIAAFPIDNP
jgi:hypothetical protein